MKKLYLTIFSSLLLSACTNNKPLTKEALVGEWVCTTEYKDLSVGTVNFTTLNLDGSMTDDNYIFDHALNVLAGQKVDNYFRSPLRYLNIGKGTWALSNNEINYHITTSGAKRIIWPDVWKGIQKSEKFKKIEANVFNIYSSSKDEKIDLTFKKFTRHGFILTQNLGDKSYESNCLTKNASKYSYIEKYKEIHQIK